MVFLFFTRAREGPGAPGRPPPHGLRGIRVRTARCDVTRMWIHISRCGSTFPKVDPHLEIWIHTRCDTYFSPVVVDSCNHTYRAVKTHTQTRTGAPGPGLRASPGLTRYSYPQAFHVLRFPGRTGSQLLGSQFDLHRCSNSSTGEGRRETLTECSQCDPLCNRRFTLMLQQSPRAT